MDYDSFFPIVLAHIPQFQPGYYEQVADNEEFLHHVLMGDFTRFVINSYRKSISDDEDAPEWHGVVIKSLDLLEQGMSSSDDALWNLVSVSFLENLWQAEDSYEDIKQHLGPTLRQELLLYE
jgi:hypothetical protein